MRILFSFLALFITTLSLAQSKGIVTGVLTDKDLNNETLPFANVMIKGTTIGATTDENGKYTLSVPAGTHTVVFSFLGYETETETITIKAGETIKLNKALGAGSVQIDEVILTATVNREKESALLLEQKGAVEIKQSIGAQEMSRKGVSTVEDGLTKITGITKVESRGLFIRGLEDRYNNLLINGLAVPSNSLFKKIVPLDLFPTDIVGFMDVYKTFNPDIYGDFAGGTININTSQPNESKTKISIGTGFTTNNNLSKFLIASDADNTKNVLGFGGDNRDLPSEFGNRPQALTLSGAQSRDAFSSGWNVTEKQSPLNMSTGVTHTGKFTVGKKDNRIGYIFSTNYENSYSVRKGVDRIFQQGNGIYDNDLSRSQYKFQTTNSTLLGVNYKTSRLKLNYNTLFIKSTENLIQDQIGYTRNNVQNSNEIIRLNQYEQSNYLNSQLFGNYALTADDRHSVKGGISFTNTQYQQPDRKFINGTINGEDQITATYGGNHLLRQYLKVNGNYFFSSFLEYNFKFGGEEKNKNKISVGYNGYANDFSSTYRFIFGNPNIPKTVTTSLNNIDQSILEDISLGNVRYSEGSAADYKTKVNQVVNAGYTNFFFKVGKKFEINAGVRAENTTRELKYRTLSQPFNSPYKKLNTDKLDILPSLNTKYLINEKSNLRLAAGKTLTRPVISEFLPIQYVNADGTTEAGNQNLINSTNYNVDLKYEIFPTEGAMIATTVFGKYIDKPIERTVGASGTGSGQIISYYNNKSATLFGVELELLMPLKELSSYLDQFSFGFNTSLMYTEATADTNRPGYFDTFEKRKLQGASNWLVNSDIKYEFNIAPEWKSTATLVYNVYGERIYAVGVQGLDHIYEKPFHQMNFVWGSNINKKWDTKFSINNILNPTYKQELGNNSKIAINEDSLLLKSYKKGVGFSLSLAYTF